MITGISEILTDNATVTALVGMNTRENKPKIYWVVCPDAEKAPYVILSLLGNNPNNKDDSSTLDDTRFAAFIYTNNPEEAEEISEAIRAALELKNVTAGGKLYYRIRYVSENDGYDKEALLPYRVATYSALWKREVPT